MTTQLNYLVADEQHARESNQFDPGQRRTAPVLSRPSDVSPPPRVEAGRAALVPGSPRFMADERRDFVVTEARVFFAVH